MIFRLKLVFHEPDIFDILNLDHSIWQSACMLEIAQFYTSSGIKDIWIRKLEFDVSNQFSLRWCEMQERNGRIFQTKYSCGCG